MPQGRFHRPIFGKKIVKRPEEQTQIIDLEATKASLKAQPKKVVREPLELKVISRARALRYLFHSFELGSKGKRITGTPTIVKDPKLYGGLFKKGEKILYVHFELTNKNNSVKQRDAVKLVKTLRDPSILQSMKDAGYVGMCGDTPTTSLAKLFEMAGGKNLGSSAIPAGIKAREKSRYLLHMLGRGYPKKYLTRPLQRIVYRF
jgi:hypothetical protein